MKYVFTTSTPFTTFAAPYGACAYGSETFQNGDCSPTQSGGAGTGGSTTTTTTTQNGSALTNTGFGIALIVGLASLLLLVALIVRFAKRSPKTTAPATEVPAVETPAVAQKPQPKKVQF